MKLLLLVFSIVISLNLGAQCAVSITNVTNNPCAGGMSWGSATATGSGGTPAYTYVWSNGQTSSTATGLAAGVYAVTVTDGVGCTNFTTATITDPPSLNLAMNSTNVLCNGMANGTANAFVSGGTPSYTYVWSNGQTTAAITGLAAGTYTTTVTDANGCSTTAATTITQPSFLNAFISSSTNVACNGMSWGSATANASGGVGAYTYLWSNGQTTATATGLPAGTYTATVTDANGCTGMASTTITQAPVLNVSIGSSTNVACNGMNWGSATATASGGVGAYTYIWSNGQTTATATGLPAGTYTATVTDGNGCSNYASATITEPPSLNLTMSSTNVLCNGMTNGSASASLSGGTPTYSYAWSNGSTAANPTGLSAGTYTVTVTDANGCTLSSSSTITEPSALSLSVNATNIACNGMGWGSATATASGGTSAYSYLWSNGQTTSTATGLPAGTYTATVTDANGCSSTSATTITEPPVLSSSITTSSDPVCPPGNGALSLGSATVSAGGGTPGYSYLWSNGQTTSTATGLSVGTYTGTVTDGAGCTSNYSVTINPAPVTTTSDAGADQAVCGNTATLAGNIPVVGTGVWTLVSGSGTITNPNSPTSTVTGLGAGANVFEWTITNGPCAPSTSQVTITSNGLPTVADAGVPQTICGNSANLAGNVPLTGSGNWTLISGSGTITNPNSPNTTVTGLGTGVNVFEWSISNAGCPPSTSQVSITSNPVSSTFFTVDKCIEYTLPSGTVIYNSGTYYDTIQSVAGCDSTFIINATIYTVDVSVTQVGNTLTANATNATFQWINCTNLMDVPGETNAVFTPSYNGSFAVVVLQECYDTSACYDISTINLDELWKDDLKIYPNPNSIGEFFISYEGQINTLEIVDLTGRILSNVQYQSSAPIKCAALRPGKYFVRIYTDKGVLIRELVIN